MKCEYRKAPLLGTKGGKKLASRHTGRPPHRKPQARKKGLVTPLRKHALEGRKKAILGEESHDRHRSRGRGGGGVGGGGGGGGGGGPVKTLLQIQELSTIPKPGNEREWYMMNQRGWNRSQNRLRGS